MLFIGVNVQFCKKKTLYITVMSQKFHHASIILKLVAGSTSMSTLTPRSFDNKGLFVILMFYITELFPVKTFNVAVSKCGHWRA